MAGEGRYELQRELAAGGMGAVFRVFDRVTGDVRALKRVTVAGDSRQFAIEAFEREYQVLASLDHPRIIRVFDYGVDAEGPYYTMELLEGRDMRHAAPVPYKQACLYLRDVATSLVLLHGRRLIHRDLSPSNVRITPDGHCKLLDFGALALFGPSRRVVGTPPFVAPEALAGAALNQRTDLFALGALAYWMLTGRHAYPARSLFELNMLWNAPPPAPSSIASGIPEELDALVLALLKTDPLARPESAAEVISRVNVIGELPVEDAAQTARLAQSFFASPRFTGRTPQMRELNSCIEAAIGGKGAALRIEAVPGMGRSRLLEELAVRARLAGATVLTADGSATRQLQGTAQALVSRAFELLPDLTRELASGFSTALAAIGRRIELSFPTIPQGDTPPPSSSLAEFFADLSVRRPLLIAVDNLEDADDASHGLLASLASLAGRYPLLVVVTEARSTRDAAELGIGRQALRRHARQLDLTELSSLEMLELSRSIFMDAPNLERFSEWLHARSAGSPLYAVEICRRLHAKGVIRYASGLWSLPADRPDEELPAALGDALTTRIDALDDESRSLAECLCLQREQPTLRLCTLLCHGAPEPAARAGELLGKLTHASILTADRGSYRFTSSALRSALLQTMVSERLERNHRRLGEALQRLAADDDTLRIEAGFHLIEGGDELRGADLIASVTHDSAKFRTLVANLYHAGRPVEAAYKVYRHRRRSAYERLPLLAALAQAGYYEDRYFGDTYGDDALNLLEELCGLTTAKHLQRFVGKTFALLFGIGCAWLRFGLTPAAQRPMRFGELWLVLFSTVTALTGIAAVSLDAERADRVTSLLEPFAFLPERLTPVGIYQFCRGLGQIPRENAVEAYATFELLLRRFSCPIMGAR